MRVFIAAKLRNVSAYDFNYFSVEVKDEYSIVGVFVQVFANFCIERKELALTVKGLSELNGCQN